MNLKTWQRETHLIESYILKVREEYQRINSSLLNICLLTISQIVKPITICPKNNNNKNYQPNTPHPPQKKYLKKSPKQKIKQKPKQTNETKNTAYMNCCALWTIAFYDSKNKGSILKKICFYQLFNVDFLFINIW